MNVSKPIPTIPAEALVRRTDLQAALRMLEVKGVSLEPAAIQALRAAVADHSNQDTEPIMSAIIAEHLEEEAAELLRGLRRATRRNALVDALTARLAPLATKAQQRRVTHWHLDTRRVLVRFGFTKENPSVHFDDGDIHTILLQAFRLEGMIILLDLGKRPRPLLGGGLPLPAGVGGLDESLDVVLKREPLEDPTALMARLNRRLPDGLRIQRWNVLPGYASQVSELALYSHWRWVVPTDQMADLENRVASFLAAEHWSWERGSSGSNAAFDLRKIIPEMHWEKATLCFTTSMGAFQAMNPLKMLTAILRLDSGSITGLVRTHVDLRLDLRLGQAERFEPKLKNMYEDAVLLGGASNIVLVDEEDDEPIRLGPPSETT